jgi:phenylpropionate dioxygenase-like ring-hydroxylating dioxygenase large terminal subunit
VTQVESTGTAAPGAPRVPSRNERRQHLRSNDWTPRPTLQGTDYTSESVYAEERERIWFGGWVCIGRDEEIAAPGDYLVRELAGESIVVTRNAGGEPRAFYNVCAHRGTKLLDETGELCGHVNKAFKCPYHSWSFDLDGSRIRCIRSRSARTPASSS